MVVTGLRRLAGGLLPLRPGPRRLGLRRGLNKPPAKSIIASFLFVRMSPLSDSSDAVVDLLGRREVEVSIITVPRRSRRHRSIIP